MEPHPVAEVAAQVLAEGGVEAEALERRLDPFLLLLRGELGGHQILRLLGRGTLGEVHQVDRGAPGRDQLLDGLVERRLLPDEVERDGAVVAAHLRQLPSGERDQPLGDDSHVAERGRHEEEARLVEEQEGDLPGHAALPVPVVVELVHDHGVDPGVGLPEGHVHQDLGGAADDGGVAVHRAVAGHHPHVLGAEEAAQVEELLVHQRLDRAGVERALAARHALEVEEVGHHRLARPGGGGEHHVAPLEQLEDGLLLRRVERQPGGGHPGDEAIEHLRVVEGRLARGGEERGEGGFVGHREAGMGQPSAVARAAASRGRGRDPARVPARRKAAQASSRRPRAAQGDPGRDRVEGVAGVDGLGGLELQQRPGPVAIHRERLTEQVAHGGVPGRGPGGPPGLLERLGGASQLAERRGPAGVERGIPGDGGHRPVDDGQGLLCAPRGQEQRCVVAGQRGEVIGSPDDGPGPRVGGLRARAVPLSLEGVAEVGPGAGAVR